MKKLSSLKLKGTIRTEQYDKSGNLKDWDEVSNTITNTGLANVAGLINGIVTTQSFAYLAVGTSSTALAASDNSLGSELTDPADLDRAAATTSRVTTSQTNDTARNVHTFTNDSSNTISVTEAGLFDTSSETSGDMLGGQTFSAKSLDNSDTLKVKLVDLVKSLLIDLEALLAGATRGKALLPA